MDVRNDLLGPETTPPAGDGVADEADPPDGAPTRQEEPSGMAGLDRKLAHDAYRKVLGGQPLTVREETALKRFEKEKDERLRWKHYGAIPQKHWREMSGRQAKVINEQALRYGIPFGGAMISLPEVVRTLHEFLADNAHKLARDDDPLMQGGSSPALERYREERALIARLDRLERESRLLPRDEVREAMSRIASILRSAGDALLRQFGPAAAEILLEALDDAERETDRAFQSPEDDSPEEHGDYPQEPTPPSSAD